MPAWEMIRHAGSRDDFFLEFIGETQAEDVCAEAEFTEGAEVTGEIIFCAGEDGHSDGVAVVA